MPHDKVCSYCGHLNSEHSVIDGHCMHHYSDLSGTPGDRCECTSFQEATDEYAEEQISCGYHAQSD